MTGQMERHRNGEKTPLIKGSLSAGGLLSARYCFLSYLFLALKQVQRLVFRQLAVVN